MKTVTAHKITIKSGAASYEPLWETVILGDFNLEEVQLALDATPCVECRQDAKDILEMCGLPEEGKDYTYKKIVGTVVGTVIVRNLKVWTKE